MCVCAHTCVDSCTYPRWPVAVRKQAFPLVLRQEIMLLPPVYSEVTVPWTCGNPPASASCLAVEVLGPQKFKQPYLSWGPGSLSSGPHVCSYPVSHLPYLQWWVFNHRSTTFWDLNCFLRAWVAVSCYFLSPQVSPWAGIGLVSLNQKRWALRWLNLV